MSQTYDKNRIVKNSLLLYIRMLFTMWLNLWATRLVLANLGVEDMGVYGVVGSIVNMFTVLTGGVTTAVQRFITFEMGRKDGRVNSVFCSSLNVIFILSALMLVLLECAGLWILNHKVNIPPQSMEAARWVFQLSVLTCIVNVISIPYNALIIAHEKMNAFAAISIVQVVLQCAAAYCLTYIDHRLVWYAALMAAIGILIRIIYQLYCVRHFAEAKYHLTIDRNELRQMLKFTGVSTASGALQVLSAQGVTLVINWTFGVALNAVYNIALQLKNSVLSFAMNIQKAIAPQITKTYANGEIAKHTALVYSGSKMQVYMIYLIMIPFLFRTDYIMHLWLGQVPEHTVVFTQCTIFLSLTYAAFEPIRTAVYATNRITRFLLIPDVAYVLVLPISYAVAVLTHSVALFAATLITVEVACCALRVWYATKVSPLRKREILKDVVLPCASVAAVSALACWGLALLTSESIWGLLLLLIANSLLFGVIAYFLGLSKSEKIQVQNIIARVKGAITKR